MEFKFELQMAEAYAKAFEMSVQQHIRGLELHLKSESGTTFRYVARGGNAADYVQLGMLMSAAYSAEKAGFGAF